MKTAKKEKTSVQISKEHPKKGDMCRSLPSYKGTAFEGRVIKDKGDQLTIIYLCDEDSNGKPMNHALFINVPTKDVAKIKDWKK